MQAGLAQILKAADLQLLFINERRQRAVSNRQEAADLGLASFADRKEQSLLKVNERFDELYALHERGTIVALCSTFERLFHSKLPTAVGAARRSLRDRFSVPIFKDVREDLVKNESDFRGIASMFALIGNRCSQHEIALLRQIREIRNSCVHGTELPPRLPLTIDQIADGLSGALDKLNIT